MRTWVSLDEARRELGADAPLDDSILEGMLEAAQIQLEAFAPSLANPETVPPNYKQALHLQVRELNRARVRDGDLLGFGDGYGIRVRPLDATVKALLRPLTIPKVR